MSILIEALTLSLIDSVAVILTPSYSTGVIVEVILLP